VSYANSNGIDPYILVGNNFDGSIAKTLLESSVNRQNLINNLLNIIKANGYKGVNIDIEAVYSTDRSYYTTFMKEVYSALKPLGYTVTVSVAAKTSDSSANTWNYAYNYASIANYADKVILMAHDYDAKKLTKADMDKGYALTPPTPLEDVYYALEQITNNKTGIQDKSKIMLQISFNWVWWQKKDNKVINSSSKKVGLDEFINILKNNKNIKYNYSKTYENPYITYVDTNTGIENIIWYENTTSVMEKIKLARFFGLQGISLWRLGTIPDVPVSGNKYEMDIWQNILKEMEKK
jgi:spore germination protein YaaH